MSPHLTKIHHATAYFKQYLDAAAAYAFSDDKLDPSLKDTLLKTG